MMDRNFALGFLVGAIDGEGSFMLKPVTDLRVLRKGRRSLSIQVLMEINNTCEAFIDRVEHALQTIAVGSFRVQRNFRSYDKLAYYRRYGFLPGDETVLGGGKNYHRLTVAGREDVKFLIRVLRDDLTAKKSAVEIVEKFFLRVGDARVYAPTADDLLLCRSLHTLQGRRRTPFQMEKWLACLEGDYEGYKNIVESQRRAKPGNSKIVYPEGVETSG